ncbi:hypothetical protein J6590_068077 [Homalodisca vitripennis]|nr:hypothetical protein J6590_068077 [Homalodisca vitripennis]
MVRGRLFKTVPGSWYVGVNQGIIQKESDYCVANILFGELSSVKWHSQTRALACSLHVTTAKPTTVKANLALYRGLASSDRGGPSRNCALRPAPRTLNIIHEACPSSFLVSVRDGTTQPLGHLQKLSGSSKPYETLYEIDRRNLWSPPETVREQQTLRNMYCRRSLRYVAFVIPGECTRWIDATSRSPPETVREQQTLRNMYCRRSLRYVAFVIPGECTRLIDATSGSPPETVREQQTLRNMYCRRSLRYVAFVIPGECTRLIDATSGSPPETVREQQTLRNMYCRRSLRYVAFVIPGECTRWIDATSRSPPETAREQQTLRNMCCRRSLRYVAFVIPGECTRWIDATCRSPPETVREQQTLRNMYCRRSLRYVAFVIPGECTRWIDATSRSPPETAREQQTLRNMCCRRSLRYVAFVIPGECTRWIDATCRSPPETVREQQTLRNIWMNTTFRSPPENNGKYHFILPRRVHFWLVYTGRYSSCLLDLGNIIDVQERHVINSNWQRLSSLLREMTVGVGRGIPCRLGLEKLFQSWLPPLPREHDRLMPKILSHESRQEAAPSPKLAHLPYPVTLEAAQRSF